MTEWKEYKLGDIISLHRGYDLPSSKRKAGNVPIVSSSGISDFHNSYKVMPPGVITGRYGTIGEVFYVNEPYWPLNTTLYVDDFKGNDALFIYYFLKSIDFEKYNDKSTIPGINRNHLYCENVTIPSLDTQRRIAAILSSLDDKIDLLHRENATLEQMAETLFRQWFVEDAKEDWEEGKLGDILSVKGGTTPSTKEPSFWDGDIAWTSPRDVTTLNGLYLFETEKRITQKGLEQISSGLLPAGTLLMSSRAPVGVLAFAEIPLAINQGYIAILDDKGYSKEFIYLWLKTNMEMVHSYSNGSTFMEISKSAFKSLDISIPSKKEVDCFVQDVNPYFEKIRTNEIQIRTLIETRDGLLPRLMSGEVKM